MSSINITNSNKKLFKLIKNANESHEPIYITSKNGSVVMISEEDWKSIEETLYLNSIPKIKKSIIKGMKEPIEICSDKLDW